MALQVVLRYGLLVLALAVGGYSDGHRGKRIGPLIRFAHNVAGTIYVVNRTHIFIQDFTYDGRGPDAFFYVGSGSRPSRSGTIMPDELGRTTKLQSYNNKDIVLTLPNGFQAGSTNLGWLSVWCRAFAANFGQIILPSSIDVPKQHPVGELSRLAHCVRSGQVIIEDHRTFLINRLYYDGRGPDAFFIIGNGTVGSSGNVKLRDETGSTDIIKRYNGEDIRIQVPESMNIMGNDYLALYCFLASQNFGSIAIPATLNIPPYIPSQIISPTPVPTQAPQPQEWDTDLKNCEHVHDNLNIGWEVQCNTIIVELISLTKDDEYVAFGVSGSDNQVVMVGADVTVTYFVGAQPKAIDSYLSAYAQCSLGEGACADTDRNGTNDAVLVSGKRENGMTKIKYSVVLSTNSPSDKDYYTNRPQYIAWAIGYLTPEKNPTKHHTRTDNADLQTTLSFGRSPAKNCMALGSVQTQPPTSPTPGDRPENCEILHERLEVAWTTNQTHLNVEMRGTIAADEYMAFGPSGREDRPFMIRADVTVASHGASGPAAVDYYLTSKAGCSNGRGACPDTMVSGTNDVVLMGGERRDGVAIIKFSKKLNTGDSRDTVIPLTERSIIWAIGKLNSAGLVTYHTLRIRSTKKIAFGRTPQYNCVIPPTTTTTSTTTPTTTSAGWPPNTIDGSTVNELIVQIGPTGGEKGYKFITGQQSWGIAYYINGLLIPELTLVRGRRYTFKIEAGDDTSNSARYHPFYITDDPIGGYRQLNATQRQAKRNYLGIRLNGRPISGAVGTYCEYTSAGDDAANIAASATFQDYAQFLRLTCPTGASGGRSQGVMSWRPDQNTPDLLYYQCYTHFRLGWKIHIVDPPATPEPSSTTSTTTTPITTTTPFTQGANPIVPPENICINSYLYKQLRSNTGALGTLSSGYNQNQFCVWDLLVEYPMVVVLELTRFNVEASADCTTDYMEVVDIRNKRLRKICGNVSPLPKITSGTYWMRILFRSDNSGSAPGLTATWSAQPSNMASCAGIQSITGSTGVITNSPNGVAYTNRANCRWRITVDPNMKIELTFTRFDLEESVQCRKDSVKIYDGFSAGDPLLLSICYAKRVNPLTVTSSGNYMYIVFVSDNSNVGSGFRGTYRSVL